MSSRELLIVQKDRHHETDTRRDVLEKSQDTQRQFLGRHIEPDQGQHGGKPGADQQKVNIRGALQEMLTGPE